MITSLVAKVWKNGNEYRVVKDFSKTINQFVLKVNYYDEADGKRRTKVLDRYATLNAALEQIISCR